MLDTSIQQLIQIASEIEQKYAAKKANSGEDFNVFKILKVESNEVSTHSAFLAEILNPAGSHGQKEKFLKLFCEQFAITNFDPKSAKVEIERHVGHISEDYSEGGFIDIIATDSNRNSIIIENKIYAGDQPNQLLRYHKAFPKSQILYLTLYGSEPSNESLGTLKIGVSVKCISYKSDILDWLFMCINSTENHDILVHTIKQYINLIKYLTNQTTNFHMSQELIDSISKNRDLLTAFMTLTKSDIISGVHSKLLVRFHEQMGEIGNELGMEVVLPKNWGNSDDEVEFQFKDSEYCIGIGFCGKNQTRFIYGISCYDKSKLGNHRLAFHNELGRGLGWESWVWADEFESEYRYWNNSPDAWLAIENGEMKNIVKAKILRLVEAKNTLNLNF